MTKQDVFNWVQTHCHIKKLNGEWNASVTLGLDINETGKNIFEAMNNIAERICKSDYLTKMYNQRHHTN